jgi:tripartite-type tricarboxylate transporter receptor subunit TctC
MLKPRSFAVSIALGAMVLGLGMASAQNPSTELRTGFPSKPIVMLSTEAGGLLDIGARIIAQGISGPLGQPVIVDNRPPSLTPEILARAPADGYTLAIGGLTQLTQKTSYDALRDFAPMTSVMTYPNVLIAHPSLPVRSVRDLIALAKANPGVLNIAATASPGAPTFLGAELLKSMGGVNIVRVPYKGTTQGLVAVISGEVHMMLVAPSLAMPSAKSGKLRALAVTSLEPSALAPGVPTVAATGLPGYEVVSLVGMLARAGTPPAIVNQLNDEIVRVLNRADVKEKFFNEGAERLSSTPAQFAAKINSEIVKWGKVLKDAGIKPEF